MGPSGPFPKPSAGPQSPKGARRGPQVGPRNRHQQNHTKILWYDSGPVPGNLLRPSWSRLGALMGPSQSPQRGPREPYGALQGPPETSAALCSTTPYGALRPMEPCALQSPAPYGALHFMEPYALQSPTEPYGAPRPSEPCALWSPTEPSGALRSLTEPHGALRSPTEPYGVLRSPAEPPRSPAEPYTLLAPTEPHGAQWNMTETYGFSVGRCCLSGFGVSAKRTEHCGLSRFRRLQPALREGSARTSKKYGLAS